MKRVRTTLFILLGLALFVGLVLFIINLLNPTGAGVLIETNPPSTVFINGEQLGRTPYSAVRKPGEVIVKLIPDSFDRPLIPYETRVNLVSGVETVIRREFAETEEMSAGEVISFDRATRGEAGIALVSIPDSAQVAIDGQIRGFAPYRTTSVSQGEHRITVRATGYIERTLDVVIHEDFILTAVVKLAPDPKFEAEEEQKLGNVEEDLQEASPKIEIQETGTGFLRVRSEPSTLGSEVARVVPGEAYTLLEVDEQTGWYRIEVPSEDGGEPVAGWISNQYAREVESGDDALVTGTPTPSPSISLTPTPTPSP